MGGFPQDHSQYSVFITKSALADWKKKKSVLTKVDGKLLNQNPGNLGRDSGFGAPQNQG